MWTDFNKNMPCHYVTHLLLVIGKDSVTRLGLSQNVQYYLPPVGCRITCDETVFNKMSCHSQAASHMKWCDETAFHRVHNVTHKLLIRGKGVMRLPSTIVQCYYVTHKLLVIGKKCDGTAFHKLCNVTYKLLVIEKDVMRLPFTNSMQ